jgi:hypothetical protein
MAFYHALDSLKNAVLAVMDEGCKILQSEKSVKPLFPVVRLIV